MLSANLVSSLSNPSVSFIQRFTCSVFVQAMKRRVAPEVYSGRKFIALVRILTPERSLPTLALKSRCFLSQFECIVIVSRCPCRQFQSRRRALMVCRGKLHFGKRIL